MADSDRHPQSAEIWSAPIPGGGVDVDLITFESLASDLSNAKGKWVCLESRGEDVNGASCRAPAQAGAVGLVITDFAVAKTSPDDVVWFNGQGFNGWYHEEEAPRLPVFSISPLRAKARKNTRCLRICMNRLPQTMQAASEPSVDWAVK